MNTGTAFVPRVYRGQACVYIYWSAPVAAFSSRYLPVAAERLRRLPVKFLAQDLCHVFEQLVHLLLGDLDRVAVGNVFPRLSPVPGVGPMGVGMHAVNHDLLPSA